jgi:hypothetical protein
LIDIRFDTVAQRQFHEGGAGHRNPDSQSRFWQIDNLDSRRAVRITRRQQKKFLIHGQHDSSSTLRGSKHPEAAHSLRPYLDRGLPGI